MNTLMIVLGLLLYLIIGFILTVLSDTKIEKEPMTFIFFTLTWPIDIFLYLMIYIIESVWEVIEKPLIYLENKVIKIADKIKTNFKERVNYGSFLGFIIILVFISIYSSIGIFIAHLLGMRFSYDEMDIFLYGAFWPFMIVIILPCKVIRVLFEKIDEKKYGKKKRKEW